MTSTEEMLVLVKTAHTKKLNHMSKNKPKPEEFSVLSLYHTEF